MGKQEGEGLCWLPGEARLYLCCSLPGTRSAWDPGLLSGAVTGWVPSFYAKPSLFPEIIRGKCARSGLLGVRAWWPLVSFCYVCPFYLMYLVAEMASDSFIAFSAFKIAFEFLAVPSEKA